MLNKSIIIVDDEIEITTSYKIFLKKMGYKDFTIYNTPAHFQKDMKTLSPALVFLDLRMPGITGEDLLEQIKTNHPDTSVFIVSGTDEVDTAVRCIKKGALDYIVKPIDKDRFQTALIKGFEVYKIKTELKEIKENLKEGGKASRHFSGIITRNNLMLNVFKYSEAVAQGESPVLITGETGTGKDLLAEAIHNSSGRKGPFVPVNVSALDENMFNDTLFGHTRGAFTGADKVRKGVLASAEDGSVFLDEIGDLKESSQIKLLRLIQNKEYLPLGSDTPLRTGARIIAATNADLEQKVAEGSFRQDLYYRLKTHTIHLPPLRERSEDIELIAIHYFSKEAENLGDESPEPPQTLLKSLSAHNFPGNIRELQSIISDYYLQFRNSVPKSSDVKSFLNKHKIKLTSDSRQISENRFEYSGTFPTLKEMENLLIKKSLDISGGNQSKAAQMLGITRQALNKRLK